MGEGNKPSRNVIINVINYSTVYYVKWCPYGKLVWGNHSYYNLCNLAHEVRLCDQTLHKLANILTLNFTNVYTSAFFTYTDIKRYGGSKNMYITLIYTAYFCKAK